MDLTQQMASLNFSSLPSNNLTPRPDICDVKLNKEDVMEEDMEQELDEKYSQARARSEVVNKIYWSLDKSRLNFRGEGDFMATLVANNTPFYRSYYGFLVPIV